MKRWITATRQNKLGTRSRRLKGLKNSRRKTIGDGSLMYSNSPRIQYLQFSRQDRYTDLDHEVLIRELENVYQQNSGDSIADLVGFLEVSENSSLRNLFEDGVFLMLKNTNDVEVQFSVQLSGVSDHIRVDWGDGMIEEGTVFSHVYAQPNSGVIKLYCPEEGSNIDEFRLDKGACAADVKQLKYSQLKRLYLYSNDKFTGDIADLPRTLEKIYLAKASNSIKGSINDFGDNLQSLYILTKGIITGNFDLPNTLPNLTYFALKSYTEVTGDVANLPSNLWYFLISTGNTMYGNLVDLPFGIQHLTISGNTTIHGDVADFSTELKAVTLGGNNTISGSISDLKPSLTYVNIGGNNTLSGDIATLKNTLENLTIYGGNTIYGTLGSIPSNVRVFTVFGNNTITGVLDSLKEGLGTFMLRGNNTVHGDVSGLPSTINLFKFENNATTGLSYASKLQLSKINQFHLLGNPGGLSNTDIDNLLMDINQETGEFISFKIIVLGSVGIARTDLSNNAYNDLVARGVTVSVAKV